MAIGDLWKSNFIGMKRPEAGLWNRKERAVSAFKSMLSYLITSPGWYTSANWMWACEAKVWFPVRAHAWVAGQVPCRGLARSNHTLMFLILSFSFPSPFSKNKINKIFLKMFKKNNLRQVTWHKGKWAGPSHSLAKHTNPLSSSMVFRNSQNTF